MTATIQTPTAECGHCRKPIRQNKGGTWGARARNDAHPWLCDGNPDKRGRHEPATDYEVVWPDGDIYANRDGEIRLTETEARATAQATGGTWRPAVTPPYMLLCFYKLTCTHEIAKRGEWEQGTDFNCREGGRSHVGAVIRRTRARKLNEED